MENVVSEHGAILCHLPCIVVVFEKNGLLWFGFKPALDLNSKPETCHEMSFQT